MIKIEDFENAPVGATATRADGSRAMKMNDGVRGWITPKNSYLSDKGMVFWNYTLDPTVPATAREALDLAWDLAHEVKPGQLVPRNTRYLERHHSGVKVYSAMFDFEVSPKAPALRTVEPLPEPEPDWLDAPAVLARTDNDQFLRVWSAHKGDLWASTSHTYTRLWQNLRDVTPLWPKEDAAYSFHHDEPWGTRLGGEPHDINEK